MLATARAEVFAARAIGLACATALDLAKATGDAEWAARGALLTPIAKAYGFDVGCRVADTAVQVHGGMGYIEETGVAQYLRDVRITPIYEGTNGIQAMDLVGRKMMDGGTAAQALLDEIMDAARDHSQLCPTRVETIWKTTQTLSEVTARLVEMDMDDRNAGAVPYLSTFARVLGAYYHLKAAAAGGENERLLARIYVDRILPRYRSDLIEAEAGAADLAAISDSALGL